MTYPTISLSAAQTSSSVVKMTVFTAASLITPGSSKYQGFLTDESYPGHPRGEPLLELGDTFPDEPRAQGAPILSDTFTDEPLETPLLGATFPG